ncbi:hypothetical protein GIB67_009975 [Kingdonia uniflora]|uniref:Wee1-like protein kinase n=1 Tax=Kingdonia uniflora TaxID=39325 RepID=A0A7J7L973_9MAGN|nr:hypothetical protein GIB67_009975 [Kingdonia uniflora]
MKRKTSTSSSNRRGGKNKDKGTLTRHLTVKLGQVSLFPLKFQTQTSSSPSDPYRFIDNDRCEDSRRQDGSNSISLDIDIDANGDEKTFILSQDFFCTPDYITPDGQQISSFLDGNKENVPCPKSPEKMTTARAKRYRHEGFLANSINSDSPCLKQVMELPPEPKTELRSAIGLEKKQNYVSQSAVALRSLVMPPPCIMNPYLKDTTGLDVDFFGSQRLKSTVGGFFSAVVGGDGLSRYRTDFHEIEQIGCGNFSRVYKALKRIDGCLYAVKHSIRQLHQDTDRRRALMEVQALAALGTHENIVGYHTSWFENEQLYIQMELCEKCLSISNSSQLLTEGQVLEAMYQVAKALQFIHGRGIAHLDVKPDNIYIKNYIYKLGDFGCATLIDSSLPIEEGDARYMPQEILNEKYDYLGKVDIFSLGATIYELVKNSPLPESGPQLSNLREGKIPLLPGHSIQFQNLLKVMVDPDPLRRPSAKELVENAIFERCKHNIRQLSTAPLGMVDIHIDEGEKLMAKLSDVDSNETKSG